MASGDRFYLLDLGHRPGYWGDVGNLIKVEGLVVGGMKSRMVLMLPEAPKEIPFPDEAKWLDAKEWTDFLVQSDNPEVLIMPAKAFHRKLRYEISGTVQQKVWVADGYKCMFCGAKMGQALMTIDHFTPLEMGGKNDSSNYLTADKKCNKLKGSMDPRVWCADRKLDYDFFVEYLRTRKLP